jgi:hypothetical protein
MSVDLVDRAAEAIGRYDGAAKKGLGAAAQLLHREVKKAFGTKYYKGGKFRDTLKVRASIRYLTPYKTRSGWESVVGTKIIQALYWELGHDNIYTRNRERVRIWEPTGVAKREAMKAEFRAVVTAIMNQR